MAEPEAHQGSALLRHGSGGMSLEAKVFGGLLGLESAPNAVPVRPEINGFWRAPREDPPVFVFPVAGTPEISTPFPGS